MVRVGRRPAGDNADGSVTDTDNIQPRQLHAAGQGGNAGGRAGSRRAAPDAGGEVPAGYQQ